MAFLNRLKKSVSKSAAPTAPAAHSHEGHDHGQCSHQHGDSHEHGAQGATPTASRGTRTGPPALSGIKNVIAIASGKGGVGKSTVTTNLAVALKFSGATVGVLDADIYGPSQPRMLGSNMTDGKEARTTTEGSLVPLVRHGVSFTSMGLLMDGDGPLVWRAPMAMKMISQFLGAVHWGNLDYLLIDLPPGTGDVQLTLAQQASLAGAVIVTTPQEVALGIAKKGLEMFRQLNIPIIGIVENMSGFTCSHCEKVTAVFKEGGGERLARELGVPFLGSIPLDTEIMMSGDDGVPVLERSTKSPAATAFLGFANRFDQQVRKINSVENGLEPKSAGVLPTGDLEVVWPDGHESIFTPYTLRMHCGCASCIDENTGRPTLDPKRVPLDIKIKKVEPVGRYALSAAFSDGHSTGIYPFKRLRDFCECPECRFKSAKQDTTFTV